LKSRITRKCYVHSPGFAGCPTPIFFSCPDILLAKHTALCVAAMYLSNTTLTAATLVVLFQNAAGMCYNPNGTAVYGWDAGSIYQPCSNDTTSPLSSVCCALNRANPSGGSINDGFTADVCLPSGLCQNILTDENGSVMTSFWRDYCTSAEWEDGKCLGVCTGAEVNFLTFSLPYNLSWLGLC